MSLCGCHVVAHSNGLTSCESLYGTVDSQSVSLRALPHRHNFSNDLPQLIMSNLNWKPWPPASVVVKGRLLNARSSALPTNRRTSMLRRHATESERTRSRCLWRGSRHRPRDCGGVYQRGLSCARLRPG